MDKQALKKAVRDHMMEKEAADLETAKANLARLREDSRLDTREQHDNSDIAEARENADLAAAFDHPVKDHHARIDVLENLDMSPAGSVGPGALVEMDGRHFMVAIAMDAFEVDGITVLGVSPQSPIVQAMTGLEAGDSFSFHDREIVIDGVY